MGIASPGSPPDAPRRRGRPALGRSAPLERDEIVQRALEIIQREGLDALSMRRLAKELGVTPMALYHHLPDKPALLEACIRSVWDQIARRMPLPRGDVAEVIIGSCIEVRRVWLEHFDLATLAVAVAAPDEAFFRETDLTTALFAAAGFPDVPLAYSAVQNFTMGAIQIAANRKSASLYFGRDPDEVLGASQRLLNEHDATPDHRAVVEARFDVGDDRHFEPALRALVAGLLAGR